MNKFESEIGKSITKSIFIYNPLDFKIDTEISLSNELNYEIIPTKLKLLPLQETKIDIKFTPTHYAH